MDLKELERLQELQELQILDTLPEEEYDQITRIASGLSGTPISYISFIDQTRQWYKSKVGLEAQESPREIAFCNLTIQQDNPLIIEDTRKDERLKDNPFVTEANVLFYTGFPLATKKGRNVGTLCVADYKPNQLNQDQLENLKFLANQIVTLLELRKSKNELDKVNTSLEEKNKMLEEFATTAAHDLKSPLSTISGIIALLKSDIATNSLEQNMELCEYLDISSQSLRELIDGILKHCKSDYILNNAKTTLNLQEFIKKMVAVINPKKEYNITYTENLPEIRANKLALEQILMNLIFNGIKYNFSEKVCISIKFWETDIEYHFSVTDNGMGIPKEQIEQIFTPFKIVATEDRFGKPGTGIGLTTVKKLIEEQDGIIEVTSKIKEGSTFHFTLPK
ncbi:ATP-binding protein [Zhouia sp. PK063]|uniref:sensor histidine kinase n=1 Tax=Zhouia sp. PK063 TaxID=3373602 RepID=UPI0037AEAEE3